MALGLQDRDACVEWAVTALVQGWDTPSLRILAGLHRPGWQELEHYLELALRELDLPTFSDEQAIRAYLRDVAADILSGAVAPVEGCHVIYRIAAQLDHPPLLLPWLNLDEGLEPRFYRELVGEELDAAIREEAERLLQTEGERRP